MLEVSYSCRLCGLRDAVAPIPFREAKTDIGVWMRQTVIPALCQDHASRSPACRPTELTRIKIPMPTGAGWLGGPVQQ